MPQERTSEGKCVFCDQMFSKRGIGRHLKACKARTEAHTKQTGKAKKLFHLKVEGAYLPGYWMHIEIPASATLFDLDHFLRNIWLECCGHLSAFHIGEQTYFGDTESARMFDGGTMKTKLERILEPGMEFAHEYDFGTTTELVLKVVDTREGAFRGQKVQVLARNAPPPIACEECGEKLATLVCPMCIYYDKAWYCDDCAPLHACGEEMLLPVVNSPRVGQCGYTGGGENM